MQCTNLVVSDDLLAPLGLLGLERPLDVLVEGGVDLGVQQGVGLLQADGPGDGVNKFGGQEGGVEGHGRVDLGGLGGGQQGGVEAALRGDGDGDGGVQRGECWSVCSGRPKQAC
jgi:hypothetical protein